LLNDNWKDTQQAAIEASSFGPPILYLASIVLFPPESALDEFVDYKAHYYANHRAFFILFSCFTPVDFADSLLKGIPHFFELGRPDHAQRTLPLILCHLFLFQTAIISFTIFHTLS